jgi:hypothetical protein
LINLMQIVRGDIVVEDERTIGAVLGTASLERRRRKKAKETGMKVQTIKTRVSSALNCRINCLQK